MTKEEAVKFVRENWDAADGCGSCGWKSALYEHEPIEHFVDDDDLTNGYAEFPCFSEDASENGGHRGIRIQFPLRRSAEGQS
jgi:hypothetical protein